MASMEGRWQAGAVELLAAPAPSPAARDAFGTRFLAAAGHLDSATSGLPPAQARAAFARASAAWAEGRYDPTGCDGTIARGRRAYARLVGAAPEAVAVGHQVSPFVGLVAAALPPGARVLVASGDFTSVTFPFAARGDLDVREVALDVLPAAIDARTAAVAVSAVQSADGRVADLGALAAACAHHGALSVVDVTQAAGWLPIGAGRFDVVVAAAYKWLMSPRGTALCALSDRARAELVPLHAGWYAGVEPWGSIYGLPLRLAGDARRFDVSPAWLAWEATTPALELLAAIGVERVHAHDVALADGLRAGFGLAPTGSAIVSLDLGAAGAERLRAAGVRCATRDGRVRLAFHLHNTPADVERVLATGVRPVAGSSSGGCSSSPAPARTRTAPSRAS